MAEFLKEEYGTEPQLIKGKGGVFDVKLNGRSIYSKHETGYFPSNEEISAKINREK
ncbi:MAG TPA: SelT/SelW/SelH family protein [Bacteroidetes bacterium]|nr:SelT/SelW/SelH family protein [Bacteroidota bacterium]